MRGGLLIREARRRAALTQAELAQRLATSQSTVARWETGRQAPSFDTVIRALRACGLDLDIHLVPYDDSDASLFDRHLAMTPDQRLDWLQGLLAWERTLQEAKRVDTAV